jgi:hypothetical protein
MKAKRKTPNDENLPARVLAVWQCVGVLRPDLLPADKQNLARELLQVSASFGQSRGPLLKPRITAAQVTELVWRNSQCIQRSCPMLLFADTLADELNEFFNGAD